MEITKTLRQSGRSIRARVRSIRAKAPVPVAGVPLAVLVNAHPKELGLVSFTGLGANMPAFVILGQIGQTCAGGSSPRTLWNVLSRRQRCESSKTP